jgi:phosphoribosylcarboxyaminoimidazole (NCAIR) mutase
MARQVKCVNAARTPDWLKISYEMRTVSAHRTLDRLYEYDVRTARVRSVRVIVAGAVGAVHPLPDPPPPSSRFRVGKPRGRNPQWRAAL